MTGDRGQPWSLAGIRQQAKTRRRDIDEQGGRLQPSTSPALALLLLDELSQLGREAFMYSGVG